MMRIFAAVCAAALTTPGCSAPPSAPAAGPDPSNPASRTPAVGYRSTTAPYSSQRPVEPGPWREQNWREQNWREQNWREQNERATPPAKPAQ
jgi:hypothetical protein